MTAFDHEYAFRLEKGRGLRQNNPHGIQTVVTARQRQRRFAPVFFG